MVASGLSAELALRARHAANARDLAKEVLALYRNIADYDCAVFMRPRDHEPLATVGVERAQLEIIQHCQRNLADYAGDLRKGMAFAHRLGGYADIEVYSSRERRELPLFCDIVRPQGVRATLVLAPRWKGIDLGMIRLERCGRISFTSTDRERAVDLLPTVEVAMAAHGLLSDPVGATPLPRLSPREAEVAYHVARGLTTGQIALLLGTSPFTVRNQIVRIFDKVAVRTSAPTVGRGRSCNRERLPRARPRSHRQRLSN
jgi:DNA-binding CsgD family transcriptional regulator